MEHLLVSKAASRNNLSMVIPTNNPNALTDANVVVTKSNTNQNYLTNPIGSGHPRQNSTVNVTATVENTTNNNNHYSTPGTIKMTVNYNRNLLKFDEHGNQIGGGTDKRAGFNKATSGQVEHSPP